LQPELREPELADLLAPLLTSSGVDDPKTAIRFLVDLVSAPGRLLAWDEDDRSRLLQRLLDSPVVIRLVRLAVLGSDTLQPSAARERAA
jgi:hypothetical protein